MTFVCKHKQMGECVEGDPNIDKQKLKTVLFSKAFCLYNYFIFTFLQFFNKLLLIVNSVVSPFDSIVL